MLYLYIEIEKSTLTNKEDKMKIKNVVIFLLLLIPTSLFAEQRTVIKVVATAYYSPLPNQKNFYHKSFKKEIEINGKGKTFSGKPLKEGIVAADLKFFPLGTILYIPGYGIGVVEDTGKAIRGRKIDLFMGYGDDGLARALKWGKREVEIEILRWGG